MDTAWLLDGSKVLVLSRFDGGVVVDGFREDDDTGEVIAANDPCVVRRVYDRDPDIRDDPRIAARNAELDRVNSQIEAARKEHTEMINDMKSMNVMRGRLQGIEQYQVLETLLLNPSGAWVCALQYGHVLVRRLTAENGHGEVSIKVAVNPNRYTTQWRISGEVWMRDMEDVAIHPTREAALADATARIGIRAEHGEANVREDCKAIGIPVPEQWANAWKERQIKDAQERLTAKQRAHLDAVREVREAEARLKAVQEA